MKQIASFFFASAVCLCCMAVPALAAEYVGIVKSVDGEAFILRQAQTLKAEVNIQIDNGDVVKTGPTGSIGLIFEDDTVVSVGPSGEIVIADFKFDPAAEDLSFVIKMLHGTVSYLSGQIAKLAPENVRVETPDATIGMRGTRILVKVE